MNNNESWTIMCAMEGILCTEKNIKTQEKALEKLKSDYAKDKKNVEQQVQEYFRKHQAKKEKK